MADSLALTVEVGDKSFPFRLCRRKLDFGPAGEAWYFWMDSRPFRSRRPGDNFRHCVDLWWSAVEQAGASREAENEINLVLAECYPLVSTARSLQDVYADAHLHQRADRETSGRGDDGRVRTERSYSLPAEEAARLRELAGRRDTDLIRSELEALFLGELPPDREMPAYRRAAQAWLGNGVVALRQGGRPGLRAHVAEVGRWIKKYRKQGNQDRVRRLLNLFAYEAKVAYYLCYASAWVALVRGLAAEGQINTTAERFLRLWHNQNQPDDDNQGLAGGARDVFCGQVLALHPLSAVVQSDPGHLAVIGRWLCHPDYEALHAAGRVGTCAAYWDVVATILTAAHEYQHARRHWGATRNRVAYSGAGDAIAAGSDEADGSFALLFEDFAAGRGLVCPRCRQPLAYRSHEPPREDTERALVAFRCGSGHEHTVAIGREELCDVPGAD